MRLSTMALCAGLLAAGADASAEGNGAAALLDAAHAERPAFLATLETLVNVDTGTGFQAGMEHVGRLLAERLKVLGAQVEVRASDGMVGGNVVATLKGRGSAAILLMIHYDTVFAEGEAQRRPFRIENGRVFGPGVADAKGGVALVLHALRLLVAAGYDGYGTLTVLFNPDEEKGSPGSRDLIRELAATHDYVLSYEPPETEAVTVATSGINYLFLKVAGVASHAGSAPEQGRNAVIELAHQLLQLNALGDPAKGTSVNWTIVKGGDRRNIIPAEAGAEGDMRYTEPNERERVIADANRILQRRFVPDTETVFELRTGRPPLPRNAASEQLASVAQEIYREIGRPLAARAMTFGTDAGYAFGGTGRPAVLETLGLVGAGLHSPEEYAELESVAPRLFLTARLVMALSEAQRTAKAVGDAASISGK